MGDAAPSLVTVYLSTRHRLEYVFVIWPLRIRFRSKAPLCPKGLTGTVTFVSLNVCEKQSRFYSPRPTCSERLRKRSTASSFNDILCLGERAATKVQEVKPWNSIEETLRNGVSADRYTWESGSPCSSCSLFRSNGKEPIISYEGTEIRASKLELLVSSLRPFIRHGYQFSETRFPFKAQW